MARVIVVGAGVVGLTSAVRLAEAGHRVDVLARDLPRETTSAVAAALWYPYLALPQDRVTAWAARSYAVFADLAADPATGVRMQAGTEVFRTPRPIPGGATRCRRCAGSPPATVCRPGTPTAGRSSRPWSRCRSTSTGWSPGSPSSAAPSPG